MKIAPLRFGAAWLFCPAHRPERFGKAWASGASTVILDLEDGTPPDAKRTAREHAMAWLTGPAAHAEGPVPALRINALRSREGFEDLAALLNTTGVAPRGALLLPKLDDAGELAWVDAQLSHVLPEWHTVGLIESARGLRCLGSIVGTGGRLAAVGFGAADFAVELGVPMDSPLVQHARCRFLLDSADPSLMRLDVPTLALDDDSLLLQDCALARAQGFGGKFAIHPRQVEAIIRAFQPTDAERQWALRVVQAHEAAGGGAIPVDGQMVDQPVVLRARAWLAAAAP